MNAPSSHQTLERIFNAPVYSLSRPLAAQYQPLLTTVVIGKGRIPRQAQGNQNLRVVVQSFLDVYDAASNKEVKSTIVSSIYSTIFNTCLDGLAFVKYDGTYYWPVTDSQARDKIAGTFRDCLAHKYKSASKSKVSRRRHARKTRCNNHHQQQEWKHEHVVPSQLSFTNNEPTEFCPLPTQLLEVTPVSSRFHSGDIVEYMPARDVEQLCFRTDDGVPSKMKLIHKTIGKCTLRQQADHMVFDLFRLHCDKTNENVHSDNAKRTEQNDLKVDESSISSCSSTAAFCIFDENCNGNCECVTVVKMENYSRSGNTNTGSKGYHK
ncbi:hypothetical protein IV203_019370 [Nitzschia inconspicua]|uniref:DUF6824 domain-containing protein n=1 Tax=Nitzschia inconspicua TaxID=303405 RepID=A0A9K3LZN2_9STRA|nr:hypothetical protein IV203_019370 [Nitzschia inconspicua]